MIIMSIDLGKARTGVAISDVGASFAFPKTVITEYNTEKLIDKLCAVIAESKPERVVVGLPKNMDGTEGERAIECKEIARRVEEKSGVQTLLWDERGTTITAHNYLSMNDVKGKKRKQTVDAVAAVIILEDYLRSL